MERGASGALAPSIPSTSYSSQLCHCLIPSPSPTFAPARPLAFAKISTNPHLQLDHPCAPVVQSPRLGRFQCLRCQNAFLFPLRPGVKLDTGIASFCGTPIYISKGKAFPLQAHSNADRRTTPHAWLGQNSKEKANEEMDERSRKFFEMLRDKERERMRHSEELKEKAGKQLELEFVQTIEWAKLLLKLQGKAKGTFWDPKPGHNIPFSDYLKLVQAEDVKYVEYGNAGKDVAVILPYSVNEGQLTSPTEKVEEQVKAKNGKIVFKRHKVAIMPADCGNDIWQKLHHQLIHVNFINSKSIAGEMHPTLVTAVVWFMRLAVVLAAYLWLDRKLYPIYRLRDPTDRPKIQRLKLAGMDEDHLGSLGQSRARFISAEERTGVTFDDFAGQDYVKRELQEVVSILKGAAEFAGLGVYCPKGVLLYGPPGTGKTLLAKAIAGEAGVPFFSASGSEFVEMFLGVAAARVRDLFVRARQFAPSIIFIDEIDAIGAKRGGPDVGGGGVEREQGLIQILTELDGFRTSNAQVLVVGATNRLDLLDPALLRKGRFDKIISIGLPTAEGRLSILRVHAKNKGWRSEDEKEILLQEVASITPDFSGAELQNVLNEASILAARRDRDIIVMEDLTEALSRQEGTFKTGQEDEVEISGEAKIRVAYREAAIAVLECYFPNRHVPFLKTTIRFLDTSPNITYKEPRGALFSKKRDITNAIVRACASRVVEEQIFGQENVSWISGASLEEAGVMADYLILQTGMTALGKLHYETKQDVVTHLGRKVQALRDEYMRYSLEKCAAILKEYRSALETIADALMEKLDIEADEIWDIFKKAPRIPQSEPVPVDENAALLYSGRWGIHGVSLPGRVTFKPGNTGFATYGAPRTMHTRVIHEDAWKAMDALFDKRAEELKQESLQNKIPEVVSSGQFF